MAKGRTSDFSGAGNGLLNEEKVQQVQDVQDFLTQQVHHVQKVQQEENKEYGTTQGKKGQKAKRINMAFSDANHEFLKKESRRQGMSATAFVNCILDQYREKGGFV